MTLVRGTNLLFGDDARQYQQTIDNIRFLLLGRGLKELVVPAMWGAQTFYDKLGPEKVDKMWTFKDRSDRELCLIPEVTGIVQHAWDSSWSKHLPKPTKLFYITRCYRYDRPQAGRYREFTQAGIEILGGQGVKDYDDRKEAIDILRDVMDLCVLRGNRLDYRLVDDVVRGIDYYTEDGFEVECDKLGAQKQVAGGGRYKQGIGWAIGIERFIMAQDPQ